MSHEMAFPVVGAVSCRMKWHFRPSKLLTGDPKWLQTIFWSLLVTRNGCKPLFGRFWRPEMAANLFLVVSGDPKWPQTTF